MQVLCVGLIIIMSTLNIIITGGPQGPQGIKGDAGIYYLYEYSHIIIQLSIVCTGFPGSDGMTGIMGFKGT